jgi:hypothetical protein
MKLRNTWLRDGDRTDFGERFFFAVRGRQAKRGFRLDRRRHDRIDQRVERIGADNRKHLRDLVVVGPDMPGVECVVVFELAQRGHLGFAYLDSMFAR